MSVYSDYFIEAKLDGTNWTDITADVIGEIKFSYGIPGSSPVDRVGTPGKIEFSLNNSEANSAGLVGYYTPGHTNCRSGFDVGLPVRYRVTFLSFEKVKFQGEIKADGISIQAGRYSKRSVKVMAMDWLYQAEIHELVTPEFAEDLAIEDIVPLILANLVKQPLATSYGVGVENFECVFDKVKSTTHALSEFAKVAMSELGFIYMTRDIDHPEILKVEGRYDRNDITDLTLIPSAPGEGTDTVITNFVDESDNFFVDESGNYFVFDDADWVEPIFDNSMFAQETPFGSTLYNRIKVTSYPRVKDAASTTVLFEMAEPVKVPAGSSISFTGKYKDPTGLYNDVSGTDMQAATATTDYQMFQNEDGTGTDMTASLTVTPTYGAKEVAYVLANGAASDGWVTKCNARGKGIYASDAVDYTVEDATSINKVGPVQLTIDMKYQNDPTIGAGVAATMLSQLKDPKLLLDKPEFYANRSNFLMLAYMFLEPGNRVRMKEEVSGIQEDYFIQGVEGVVRPGGLIKYKFIIRNAGYDTYVFGEWDECDWDASDAVWAL